MGFKFTKRMEGRGLKLTDSAKILKGIQQVKSLKL